MSFKMTKTFDATMTSDGGLIVGTQQIEAEVVYTVTLIQIVDAVVAHATISASVNGQAPAQTDVFQFPYSMSGAGLFEQAESTILASEKYAGAVSI